MTSAEKKAFVLTAVLLSFFTYLAAAALSGRIFAESTVQSVGPFVCASFVLGVVMKKFPEEVGNETEEETEQISAPPRSKLKIFGYTAASVLLMLSVNFAVAFIAGDASVPDRENLLLRAAAGVLLVPAMEEYLFRRGYLKTLLKGGFPLYVPVIMQAVLFASLHRGTGVPVAFVCGTVLGVLYVKTEERHAFAAVFSAHAVYNGALYLILALS